MPENYAQEPAEEYGDQLQIEHRIQFQFAPIAVKAIQAIPLITRDPFVTYCVLMKYANKSGHAWPTLNALMYYTGFGRNRLIKSLKVLCDNKMVEKTQMRKGREFGANRYTLTDPSEWTFTIKDGVPILDTPKESPHSEVPIASTQTSSIASSSIASRSKHTQKRAREESDFSENGEREEQDGVATGEELEERQCPYCDDLFFGTHECCGEVVTEEELDHGCAMYHPGLPCAHEQEVLSAVRGVLWPSRIALPKSHPNVQVFAHRYDDRAERVDAAVRLATWWKESRKPRDWTIPLMFADAETELANAQAVQAPGGGEDIWARWAREEREREARGETA